LRKTGVGIVFKASKRIYSFETTPIILNKVNKMNMIAIRFFTAELLSNWRLCEESNGEWFGDPIF
jgi:hypothetical protein